MKSKLLPTCILFVVTALVFVRSIWAGELIYSQPWDNWTSFYSFDKSDGSNTYEGADDFEIIGTIDRIIVNGYLSSSSDDVNAVFIRFYEYGTDGKPGSIQGEYFLQAGDPNLLIEPQSAAWIDARLSPPFLANGKHFLAVQPVTSGPWNWWNANHTKPVGQLVYTRANQGPWSHPISIVTGQPYDSDLAFALYGTVTGAPRIDSLSAATLQRSGYLEIFGANFGGSGTVLIDGIETFYTTWTGLRIVAYVPEAARLASVPVQVVNAGGSSNVAFLNVTLRISSGRLKWRFRMDGPYAQVRPVIGSDGTVYAVDVFQHLYALTPDGALKWLARGAGNKGVAVGQDGTVYVGSEDTIKAYYPYGTLKWTFVQNPRAFILIGISVGPDGNLFGVATSGIGIFSLTPAGTLRWTQPEEYRRPIVDYAEIVFGPNGNSHQLYFSANNHTRSLLLDGKPVFTLPATGQPAIGPDGSVHIGGGTYDPNGNSIWSFHTPLMPPVDVGSDGITYGLSTSISLFAVNPNGSERWHVTLPEYLKNPMVAPLNTQVILGGAATLNYAGYIDSVNSVDGKVLWRHEFPMENGFNQFIDTRVRFTEDGNTFYIVTATATGDHSTSRSFVNAFDATGNNPPPPPPPPSTKLRSTNISLSAKARPDVVTINGAVTVKDEANKTASGATVSIKWTLPGGSIESQNAVTDSKGIAKFKTSSGHGTYTLTVTNITKTGYTFDSGGSVLSKSITK